MKNQLILVNEKDKIIGKENEENAHEKHMLHRAVHVIVFNSAGEMFCRKRNSNKKVHPGYWSTSTGRHVFAGETYKQAGKESLKSIGITVPIKYFGKMRVVDNEENEISAIYTCKYDGKIKLDRKEVENGKFLSKKAIAVLLTKKNVTTHLRKTVKLFWKS